VVEGDVLDRARLVAAMAGQDIVHTNRRATTSMRKRPA